MNTALLIIDMQQALTAGAYRQHDLVTNTALLLSRARTAGVPVIYLRHDGSADSPDDPLQPGTPAWQIDPTVAPHEADLVIDKQACDSFYQTTLQQELTARSITHLVIAGMATDFCVDTTCRRAISLGYGVTLAADAHSTADDNVFPDRPIPAAQIIAHHNLVLGFLAHPNQHIRVVPAAEIDW
jgi:nicotinamidase-related amidase